MTIEITDIKFLDINKFLDPNERKLYYQQVGQVIGMYVSKGIVPKIGESCMPKMDSPMIFRITEVCYSYDRIMISGDAEY